MIQIENIVKSFGRIQALKGVTAHIPAGRTSALVGPNGSGKTTLMKCLLGLVRPDSGQILLQGQPLTGAPAQRLRIGYMPQLPRYPDNLSVAEVLELIAGVRAAATRDTDLSSMGGFDSTPLFDLNALGARKLRGLSGGTLQRVGAELAWRTQAPLLVLDEPTAGLDPLASSRLKDRLLLDRQAGRTVLISSHVLADLQELADHIIFLLEGRVCYTGSLQDLLERTGESRLERAVASLMRAVTA
ncbi:MAG: ABC transporter ATP-binding protein [Candidatus Delongbacteria bacterium]|nr:ABC transporter ATP-binding protein [Candidatus Cloacimonadota bacterium]MCB9473256.1 ABC transporter ATP-binding protein [Candidatus Delongbacteria bacterium]